MHPNEVVTSQQRVERLGETPVHKALSLVVFAPELHEAEAEMQKWPQCAVDEMDIKRAIFRLRQINRGIRCAISGLRTPHMVRSVAVLPAPAEPQRSRSQSVSERHGQTACSWTAFRRQRNPIGYDYNARHIFSRFATTMHCRHDETRR